MKTFRNVFFILVSIFLLTTCSDPLEFDRNELPVDELSKAHGNKHHRGSEKDRYVRLKKYDGLKIHYKVIGKGPVDMVFIPGWTNPLEVYTKQFTYFKNKARCIYIDLPGTGLSDAPEGIEYTQPLMADAIYDVVKKEKLKKFIGVGFSWGDSPLKIFEMKHPGMIIQLMLLDVGIPTWPPVNEALRDGEFAFWSTQTYDQKLDLLPLFINPDTAPDDLWEFGQQFADFPSWLMANMRYHWQAEEVCQPYPWDIPILVIYRAMDDVKEAKTRLHYPDCVIELIEGDQHVMQWAYHKTVNKMIKDFIDKKPGKKPGKKH